MKLHKFFIFGLEGKLRKQVFISSDSNGLFGLGTGKKKKVLKSIFNSYRHLFAPQARRRIELTFCV
jgi:hypothetical protein